MLKILRIIPSVSHACNVRGFARFTRKNPGIDARMGLIKKERIEMTYDDIENSSNFDDLESDFFHINEADREYERETKINKEFISRKIVEQKYFEEQQPNFLTWSEKEQIRFLHSDDPEKWTIEKIVESFPVTEKGAKKLLKVVWKPASEKRISRHDASAMRNWNELRESNMEGLTPKMREHILNFSNRVIPTRSLKNKVETVHLSLGENISGEYSDIITSYQKKIETEYNAKMITDNNKPLATLEQNKSTDKTFKSPKEPLGEVRSKIMEKVYNNENVSMQERLMLSSTDAELKNSVSEKNYNITTFDNVSSNKTKLTKFDDKNKIKPNTEYLEKIVIPKNVWKRGGTYKVDDCYYDDDGLFLYRVPGMYN